MKKQFLLLMLVSAAALYAEELSFSGIFDSKMTLSAGAGNMPRFVFGMEEYANLRLQSSVGERATFYGAFNAVALAGSSAESAHIMQTLNNSSLYSFGDNYGAALELERLYFHVNGSIFDAEAGLMRLAFGFGQIFAPSDFLNPRNPLVPDARPRGVLGGNAAWYPGDNSALTLFAAAPKNSLNADGSGFLFGISDEYHWDRASVQALYAFETPQTNSEDGIHRIGLSIKVDVEAGVWSDILLSYNNAAHTNISGLSFSAGADYSFYNGKCYVLAEYLYSGDESVTSRQWVLTGFLNNNYLYALYMFRFNDYTNASAACLAGLNDASFTPVLSIEYEVFQGCTLSATLQIPLAAKDNSEFAPQTTGSHALITLKARLRL